MSTPASLLDAPRRQSVVVTAVAGPAAFRRRIMEMGLVPGTTVTVIDAAPLGDPLQLEVRGARWSIRRAEAAQIEIRSGAAPSASAGTS